MIEVAIKALRAVGYDTQSIKVVVRADMLRHLRGMCLEDGMALDPKAFASQDVLNCVMEEELLHLMQKEAGRARVFGPGTARMLEEEVNAIGKFPIS